MNEIVRAEHDRRGGGGTVAETRHVKALHIEHSRAEAGRNERAAAETKKLRRCALAHRDIYAGQLRRLWQLGIEK